MDDSVPTINWTVSAASEGVIISLDESGENRLDLAWAVNHDSSSSFKTLIPGSLKVGHSRYPFDIGDLTALRPDIQEAVGVMYEHETAQAIGTALERGRGNFEVGPPVMAWRDVAPGVQIGSSSKNISLDTEVRYGNDIQGTFQDMSDGEPVEVTVNVNFQTRRRAGEEILVDKSASIIFAPKDTTNFILEWNEVKDGVSRSQSDVPDVTRAVISLVHLAETYSYCDRYLKSGDCDMDDEGGWKVADFCSRDVQQPNEADFKHIESFSSRFDDNQNALLTQYQKSRDVSTKQDLSAWLSASKTILQDRLKIYSDILNWKTSQTILATRRNTGKPLCSFLSENTPGSWVLLSRWGVRSSVVGARGWQRAY